MFQKITWIFSDRIIEHLKLFYLHRISYVWMSCFVIIKLPIFFLLFIKEKIKWCQCLLARDYLNLFLRKIVLADFNSINTILIT